MVAGKNDTGSNDTGSNGKNEKEVKKTHFQYSYWDLCLGWG